MMFSRRRAGGLMLHWEKRARQARRWRRVGGGKGSRTPAPGLRGQCTNQLDYTSNTKEGTTNSVRARLVGGFEPPHSFEFSPLGRTYRPWLMRLPFRHSRTRQSRINLSNKLKFVNNLCPQQLSK